MKPILKVFALLILPSVVIMGMYNKPHLSGDQLSKNIHVENPIQLSRTNETIALSQEFVQTLFPNQNAKYIQVKDLQTNQLLITQSIDYNQDGNTEEFLFQSNFSSHEKKVFTIYLVDKNTATQSMVHAYFIPTEEGMEDFSWENDCIGYRFYGQTRAELQSTGTAMDIWCKRTAEDLTEKWYSGRNYHIDIGFGADHYNSGQNQGCGGSGLLINDSIYFSQAFSDWKIISNGPIRAVFELKFKGWEMDSNIVETKTISFDAGQYFNKIDDKYSGSTHLTNYKQTIGIVQHEQTKHQIEKDLRYVACWEALGEDKGELGTGFISTNKIPEIHFRNNHVFSVFSVKPNVSTVYYAGAAWSEFGSIDTMEEWKKFIENKASQIQNPCIVCIKE
jgi:hypothetical protein